MKDIEVDNLLIDMRMVLEGKLRAVKVIRKILKLVSSEGKWKNIRYVKLKFNRHYIIRRTDSICSGAPFVARWTKSHGWVIVYGLEDKTVDSKGSLQVFVKR